MTSDLARAGDAATDDERLAALLAIWQDRPLDELAPLIERAAAAARKARPSAARTSEEEHQEFLAVEARRDPADLDWLLAHVVATRGLMARERIRKLVRWPRDPRFAPALLGMAHAKPLSTHRPFWTSVFSILRRNARPALLPVIEPLLALPRVTTFDDHLQFLLRRFQAECQAIPAIAATPDELARIAAIAQRMTEAANTAPRKTTEDFLRDIWQSPRDDGLREVFADWLLQHDDPRGEFIALQLADHRGALDGAGKRRERMLLAAHARAWMGALAPAVHPTKFRFERGFLASCTIVWRRLASAPALMTDPAWTTVRAFAMHHDGDPKCAAWLAHMQSLGARRVR